jgi:two-component system OmpR family sensor kinase
MKAPGSPPRLASRLGRALLTWIGALWVATALATAWWASTEIDDTLDSALTETAWQLLDLITPEMTEVAPTSLDQAPPGQPERTVLKNSPRPPRGPHVENDYLIYQVVNPSGELLIRSRDAPEQPLQVPRVTACTNRPWRVYTLAHPISPVFIHVADLLSHRQHAKAASCWIAAAFGGLVARAGAADCAHHTARAGQRGHAGHADP